MSFSHRLSESEATNMLWRRETRREGTGEHYEPRSEPEVKEVTVCRLKNFESLDAVLYAEVRANITDLSPRSLAERAIRSARSGAGRRGRDGVTYLVGAKKNGVKTPLMPEYEREILRIAGTETLEQAHAKLTRRRL